MTLDTIQKVWRRLTIIGVMLVVLAIAFNLANASNTLSAIPLRYRSYAEWGLALIWFLVGAWLVHYISRIARRSFVRIGDSDVRTWTVITRILSTVLYAFVGIITLNLLNINLGSLLVGGALTGVIVGIAAQSTLANLFAGLLLFLLRPFSIGETISFRSSFFSTVEYTGRVIDINWYHTILLDGDRKRILPNSAVLSAAITVHSHGETQKYSVPVPLSVSFADFEARLAAMAGHTVESCITEFCQSTYTVEIHLPASCPPDMIRAALSESFAEDPGEIDNTCPTTAGD